LAQAMQPRVLRQVSCDVTSTFHEPHRTSSRTKAKPCRTRYRRFGLVNKRSRMQRRPTDLSCSRFSCPSRSSSTNLSLMSTPSQPSYLETMHCTCCAHPGLQLLAPACARYP